MVESRKRKATTDNRNDKRKSNCISNIIKTNLKKKAEIEAQKLQQAYRKQQKDEQTKKKLAKTNQTTARFPSNCAQ